MSRYEQNLYLRTPVRKYAELSSFKLQCSFPSLENTEETSKELANFSIGIDLLGPDPTSSKNKSEFKKKLASRAFRKFVEDQLQQILAERHSLGTEQTPTGHQQHLKAKFPFLLLFLNLLCTLLSPDNPTGAGKFLSQ